MYDTVEEVYFSLLIIKIWVREKERETVNYNIVFVHTNYARLLKAAITAISSVWFEKSKFIVEKYMTLISLDVRLFVNLVSLCSLTTDRGRTEYFVFFFI